MSDLQFNRFRLMNEFHAAATAFAVMLIAGLTVAQETGGGKPSRDPSAPASPPGQSAPQPPAQDPEAPPQEPSAPAELPPVDPKWLDRLPKEDREAIDELRGYAPPALADDLKWIDSEALNWERLRGKVVVVQSWTTGTSAGRGWPMRVARALEDIESKDFQILALHTPENAETAEEFMKRQRPPQGVIVAIDPSGKSCDALGIYKQPVNFVVDKNGMVRYTGLNLNGLKNAVAELVKEPFDRKVVPPQRPQEKSGEQSSAGPQYPSQKGTVTGATDLRGKPAPDFVIESWYTNQMNVGAGVTIITFWKVDEPASLASHGHLKKLQSQFGDRVAIVVVSGDSRSHFERETIEKRLTKSDFDYGVALDRNQQMATAANVMSFPHTIVMSRDWIVRWQGQPSALTPAVVQQIIDADAASAPARGAGGTQPKRRGWVR